MIDLSDIDSRMADLDEMLSHSEEGGGLSADVVQDESADDSNKAED